MATIHLNWTASTDNIAVTGYLIERQNPGGGGFVQITTTSATSYDDVGLTSGATYSYRIRATDAAANLSAYSGTAVATALPLDSSVPTAPTGLTATVTGVGTIHLVWTAATDDVAVTGYLVERQLGTDAFVQVGAVSGTTLVYNDTGLISATTYNYRVRATDASANLGPYSSTATATTSGGSFVTDDFNRADGSLGANWTYTMNTQTTFQIVSNTVAVVSTDLHAYAYWNANSFGDDQYAEVTLTNQIHAWTGVILRADSVLDRYYLGMYFRGPAADHGGSFNGIRIFVRWEGAYIEIDYVTDTSWVLGDVLGMSITGLAHPITIKIYKNGTVVRTWVSPDSTYIRVGGSPGIGLYSPAGQSNRLDDWKGGYLGSSSILAVSDNFNRANGVLGSNWSSPLVSDAALQIIGNKCGAVADVSFCHAYWSANTFGDNQFAQFRWGATLVGYTGVILRADNVVDKFFVGLASDNDNFKIYVRWLGAFTQLATVASVNLVDGDIIRFEVSGSTHPFTLKMYKNAVLKLTWTSPDSTYVKTGGSPGISINSPVGANLRLDDFQAGDL